jgi:hypothetical protein
MQGLPPPSDNIIAVSNNNSNNTKDISDLSGNCVYYDCDFTFFTLVPTLQPLNVIADGHSTNYRRCLLEISS